MGQATKRKKDAAVRGALLVELHRIIAESAESAASMVGVRMTSGESVGKGIADDLAYPPRDGTGPVLTRAERLALGQLDLSQDARSGFRKIVADACASTVFQLFALVDGVADPEMTQMDDWLGADIVAAPDEDREMLHDGFYESYWEYRKLASRRR